MKRDGCKCFPVSPKVNAELKFKSEQDAVEFLKIVNGHPFRGSLVHGFASSFPERRADAATNIFCGGAEYFSDLADTIKAARFSILITGWFLTPQLYLKRSRPKGLNQKYRLDNLLQKKGPARRKGKNNSFQPVCSFAAQCPWRARLHDIAPSRKTLK